MKKANDRTKRWLMIAGLGLICVSLIAIISAQFLRQPPVDEPLPPSSEEMREVEVTPIQEEKELVIQTEPQAQESSEAAASSGTEQTIQPDPVKPSEPEKPEVQGDTSNSNEPPAYKPEDTVKAPASSQPQGGERNDKGQVYFPGFGWIEDQGGGTHVEYADDMYENGNKIGQMG